jgi:hypothetical protein
MDYVHRILGVKKTRKTSFPCGNARVINESKTVKAFTVSMCISIDLFAGPRYTQGMKVNTVGKRFSETEKAYLAGFLDADGAIMASIERHREKKFGFRVRVTLKVSQSDRMIVDFFWKKARVGSVRKNRTAHDWNVLDQNHVRKCIEMLEPFLKVKKRQAEKALTILRLDKSNQKNFLKAAKLADKVGALNCRSKGRRKNFLWMIEEHLSRND